MAHSQPLFYTFSATDANAPAIPSGVMTGTAVIYSALVSGKDRQNLSGQIFWTGTPTGTFVLQYSDVPFPNQANDNDWTADTATFTQPAGGAGSTGFSATTTAALSALHRRVKYTNTSGVGTCTGFAYAPQMR